MGLARDAAEVPQTSHLSFRGQNEPTPGSHLIPGTWELAHKVVSSRTVPPGSGGALGASLCLSLGLLSSDPRSPSITSTSLTHPSCSEQPGGLLEAGRDLWLLLNTQEVDQAWVGRKEVTPSPAPVFPALVTLL